MKISDILELSPMKILLSLNDKELRHSDLSRIVRSRGTLGLSLKELESEGLIQRRVVVSRPIQSYYSLTKKGKRLASKLIEGRGILQENE